MKKITKILFLFLILLFITAISFAVDSTIHFSTSQKELSPGDVFSVEIEISHPLGINGIQIPLSFDQSALEFQKVELIDSTNYVLFGSDYQSIEILSNTGKKVPCVLHATFRVTDNVSTGTYSISANHLQISHLDDEDVETLDKKVSVSIKGTEKSSTIMWVIGGTAIVTCSVGTAIFLKRK